jgi:hypothetical protein
MDKKILDKDLFTDDIRLEHYNMLNQIINITTYPWNLRDQMVINKFVPTYKNLVLYYKPENIKFLSTAPPKFKKKKPQPGKFNKPNMQNQYKSNTQPFEKKEGGDLYLDDEIYNDNYFKYIYAEKNDDFFEYDNMQKGGRVNNKIDIYLF